MCEGHEGPRNGPTLGRRSWRGQHWRVKPQGSPYRNTELDESTRLVIHLRVGFGDVIKNEIFDLPLNVSGLVAHRHLCKTGQINEG